MFRGRYETTLDGKGRTSLPARFRDGLTASDDNRLVISEALDPCLVAYPFSGWNDFEKKLEQMPTFDRNVIRIKRLLISSAVECPVDSHGRVLIPQKHREYAGITREVIWSGMVGYMELWDAERWREAFESARANADGLGPALADLGL